MIEFKDISDLMKNLPKNDIPTLRPEIELGDLIQIKSETNFYEATGYVVSIQPYVYGRESKINVWISLSTDNPCQRKHKPERKTEKSYDLGWFSHYRVLEKKPLKS